MNLRPVRSLVRAAIRVSAALLLAAGLPAVARAESAVANRTANLRAGPGGDYPIVVTVEPGTPLEVRGCLDGYSWCDVSTGDFAGWVFAGSLSYPYQGRPVPVYGYGAAIGLPIVVFSIGPYWDTWYRGRPFYRDRYRWENRPAHGWRPPRPPYTQPPPGRPVMGHPPGRPVGARPPGGPDGRPDHRPPGGRPVGGRPPGDGRPVGMPPRGDGARPPQGSRPPSMGGGHSGGGRPSGGSLGGNSGGGHSGGGGGGGGRGNNGQAR